MHQEARAFVYEASLIVNKTTPQDALEIGSRDVNGNCREYFPTVNSWYGIDLRDGPNVDEVADAETWVPIQTFDLVLCTEVLEHAKNPRAIVDVVYEALDPGGYFIMTCALLGRRPHDCDGNHPAVMTEHYRNIACDEMAGYLENFSCDRLKVNHTSHDLYAIARK